MCSTQLIVGFSGVVGMNWGVVIKVAKAYGIEIDKKFFSKLKDFETVFLEEVNAKRQ